MKPRGDIPRPSVIGDRKVEYKRKKKEKSEGKKILE